MKAAILVIVVTGATTLVLCGPAVSGIVNIWADPGFKDCFDFDFPAGNHVVYVTHDGDSGGVRFRITSGGGFTATLIDETINYAELEQEPFYYAGNTQDGIEVIYLPGNVCGGRNHFLIATLTYYEDGTSAPCSYLEGTGHPDAESGMVEYRKCPDMEWTAASLSYRYHVNAAHWTPEYDGCSPWCFLGTPVERSTWGAIKAIFE